MFKSFLFLLRFLSLWKKKQIFFFLVLWLDDFIPFIAIITTFEKVNPHIGNFKPSFFYPNLKKRSKCMYIIIIWSFRLSRFILWKKTIPLQNGRGNIFWKAAACNRSMTSSCDNDCSIKRQNRTALPSSRKLWKSSVRASGYWTISCRVAWLQKKKRVLKYIYILKWTTKKGNIFFALIDLKHNSFFSVFTNLKFVTEKVIRS